MAKKKVDTEVTELYRNTSGKELRLPDENSIVKIVKPNDIVKGSHWKRFFELTKVEDNK